MNREEAAWLLATIAAPYPGEPFTDDAAEVWFNSTLHAIDFDEGMELADLLVKSEEFRPTPAVFNREMSVRRRHAAINQRPALPAGRPGWPAELVSELKATLRKAASNRHWHGGPDPCPVCGGMQLPKPLEAPRKPVRTGGQPYPCAPNCRTCTTTLELSHD